MKQLYSQKNDAQLQITLYAVFEYYNIWALQVNMSKSKAIILAKCKVRKNKTFDFGNNAIS